MRLFPMIKKAQSIGLIFAISAACTPGASHGYEQATHVTITSAAIQRSVLYTDSTLLSDLGISSAPGAYPEYNFGSLSSGDFFIPGPSTPPQIFSYDNFTNDILFGASFEDDAFKLISINHFFDPQWNNGTGRGLTLSLPLVPTPLASPDWIIGDAAIPPAQYFSYFQAHASLYAALTQPNPSDRIAAFGRAFQSLGHVTHHIEDMAQPQHVRNEQHLHGFRGLPDDASAEFEKHTLEIDSPAGTLLNNLNVVWPRYPIPAFENVRQYWSSYNSSSYVGMAEFTSRNFATFRNPLSLDNSTGLIKPAIGFPLPSAYNKDGTKLYIISQSVSSTTMPTGGTKSGYVGFIVANIGDDLPTNTANTGRRIAIETSLPMVIDQTGKAVRQFASNNRLVWDENYQVLLPRAVAFSAGVINHFFRARASLTRLSGTTWQIKNPTIYPMNGTWTILQENQAGLRTKVTSLTSSLPAQSSASISFPEPVAGTAKLIVAWTGQVGTELGAAAGQVITYVPPTKTVTCGGPYFDSQLSHNFGVTSGALTPPNASSTDSVLELGSTAGLVQISYWIIPTSVYTLNYTQYLQFLSSPFAPGSGPSFPTGILSATLSGKYGNSSSTVFTQTVAGNTPTSNAFSFQHSPTGTYTKLTLHEAYPFYFYDDVSAQSKSDIVKQVSCPGQSLDTSKGLRVASVGVKVPVGLGACGMWTFNVNGAIRQSYGVVTVPIGSQINVTATLAPSAPGHLTCDGGTNPVPGTPYYVDGSGTINYPFPPLITVK